CCGVLPDAPTQSQNTRSTAMVALQAWRHSPQMRAGSAPKIGASRQSWPVASQRPVRQHGESIGSGRTPTSAGTRDLLLGSQRNLRMETKWCHTSKIVGMHAVFRNMISPIEAQL